MKSFTRYSLFSFFLLSLLLFQCNKDTSIVQPVAPQTPIVPQSPVVTLNPAFNITISGASTGGSVTSDGGATVTSRGVCWSSTNATPTTADSKTSDGTGTGDFSSVITGLTLGTTYNLRAYATNSVGTSYSSVTSFKTLSLIPTLTTIEPTLVSSSSLNTGGNITSDGGSPITARGVCWSTSTGPTTLNSKTTDGTGIGTFTSVINGLAINTQYYVRAYATNSVGTAYGSEMTLKTILSGTTVAGGNGNGPAANQLQSPSALFIDALGNMFIADQSNNRVQKWAAGATSGTTVAGGNGAGPAANQLNGPSGVFVDGSGNIYITEVNNNRIQKWAPGATSGTTVAGGNGAGSAANQLYLPQGLFVDASRNIYVADPYNNHRIQKWAPGAINGTTVAGGNGKGAAANQLNFPEGLFVDLSGNIYVSDTYNSRIQKWAPGATSGTTVAGGNGAGSAANQLNFPRGLFVDASGNIYVADIRNHRIQKWAPGATSGITVAGGNGNGPLVYQLDNPSGVFVDASGNIYVADQYNNRIQKWAK